MPDGFRFLGETVRLRGWRISLTEARFSAPDGTPFERDVVRHPGAVAVVAVTDNQEVLLVRQYRGAIDRKLLEIPAGTRDVEGEPPEETARRELLEEVGVNAQRITPLGTMLNSPGFCDQETRLYLATELEAGTPGRHGVEEEDMEVVTVALTDVDDLIASGELVDAQTLLGLLLARDVLARAEEDTGTMARSMIGIDDRGDGDAAVLSISAEEFLTWLAVEKGRARNTVVAYRRDLLVYEAFLTSQGRTLDDADPGVVEDYVADRRLAGLRPPSVARAQAAVRGLHRFRLEEGFAVTDPTTDVRPPGPTRRLPKALSEEETEMLLDAVSGGQPADLRDAAMLEVLYGTGMRVSELAGLSLADLGSDTGLVRVLGKGSKERLVPLGSCASAALDDWLGPHGRPLLEPRRWARRGDAEAVFLNARGGRLTRQGVWGVLKKRARAVGLEEKVHPHVLRHSCATHMLAHGADIRVVQELLGHVSIATTQIYTKVSLGHLREAYDQAHPRSRR